MGSKLDMGKDYSIFDNMIEGCQIISPDWRYLYVNDAAAKQSGVKKEDLLGKKLMEVYPSIEKTVLFFSLQNSMKERVSISMENEFTFLGGGKGWFELRIEPVPEGILIFSIDITERKQAEETLKESEERYHSLFKNNHAVMLLIDPDTGNIMDANPAACSFYGYSKNELLKMKITDINVFTEKQVFEEMEKARSEKRNHFIFKHRLASGDIRNVDVYSGSVTVKGKLLLYSIIHDITKQIEVEKALHKSKERYKQFFNNPLNGFALCEIITDEKGKPVDFVYLKVNNAFEEFTGLKKEEVLNKRVIDIIPPEEIAPAIEIYGRVALTGESEQFEISIPFLNKTFNIAAFSPQKMQFIAFFTDITERKKSEEEIERHDKLLEGINKVLHGSITLETEEEVAGKCLEVAEDLTGSQFGFLSEINPDRRLDTLALSPSAWESFKITPMKANKMAANIEIVSYWGRTIKEEKSQIVNDPESDPDRRGFPVGHPKITSFLGVPLKQKGKAIGMIALANKEGGYAEEDVESVESLSVAFVEALMRKRAEIRLKESHDVLEESVEERTVELEEAYNALKESEKKFRGIFDNAIDMISLISVEGDITSARYVEVNNAGIKRLGYSREELLNMGPFDIDEGPETQKHVAKLLKEGYARFETIHVARDGKRIPVDVNVHFMNYGGMKVALEIVRDISERKKAEEKINQYKDQLEELVKRLRESKAHFKSLSENSPDLIVRVDKDLNYLYVNPAVMEITGKLPEYFIGKNIEGISVPEEYTSLWKDEYQKAFKTGKTQHMEFEFPTITGLRSFERITVPEFNDECKVETALSISRDITERKEVEKKLEETINELKRSNEELQSFAYVASHDLQEPLRTISSFTQLLQRRYEGKLDPDADEFIEFVVEAAQRMQQMIHDLLDYSRIMTKGKEFEEVNSENLLKEVIRSLKTIIDENNAVITYDKLPIVIGDKGQLLRVFQNLIVNAIKFRKPDEPPIIYISCRKDEENNEYVFLVVDNGIGIEKQYFDRIFTIFQRLHTRDEYQGTGIGLSLVKRIVERHGGQMHVESELGKGSTFYFSIPFPH